MRLGGCEWASVPGRIQNVWAFILAFVWGFVWGLIPSRCENELPVHNEMVETPSQPRIEMISSDSPLIESPKDPRLAELCNQLRELSSESDGIWPTNQLERVGASGVYHWFVPEKYGGAQWSDAAIASGYVQLSAACLTTTFIVTQRVAAIRRICASENVELIQRLLPGLMTGTASATVGISHLTTSRQHFGQPALRASEVEQGFRVDGFSPWVTGASGAAFLVLGAQLDDGQQILFCIASDAQGITIEPGFDLISLTGSQTGAVKCNGLFVGRELILAGPQPNVLATPTGSGTGGLQTSALALGLAQSAIDFIRSEARKRANLQGTCDGLAQQHAEIQERLLKLAEGVAVCTNEQLRTDANSIVLRATQAALVAAKGAGYVKGHRVGRWCQEALFFLVWSCPQPVLDANLCELVGMEQ